MTRNDKQSIRWFFEIVLYILLYILLIAFLTSFWSVLWIIAIETIYFIHIWVILFFNFIFFCFNKDIHWFVNDIEIKFFLWFKFFRNFKIRNGEIFFRKLSGIRVDIVFIYVPWYFQNYLWKTMLCSCY